jgi:hypothetical protein
MVKSTIAAVQLLEPETFEMHYEELSQVMMFMFHTIAYSLDNLDPDELEESTDEFRLITNFCIDAIYRVEICREDFKVDKTGNILVDGFDFFDDETFIDLHELLSALEIIESFYSEEVDQWILGHKYCDIFLKFLVGEFKRKGELLTIIDMKDDAEVLY